MLRSQQEKAKLMLEFQIKALQEQLDGINQWLLDNPAADTPSHEEFVKHWNNGGLEK